MTKLDRLSIELRKENDFVKAYLGVEDFWIVIDEVEAKATRRYGNIVRKHFLNRNILFIEPKEERDLLEEIDKSSYKVVYR